MSIAQQVRARREAERLTQGQLADVSGISRQSIAAIEGGTTAKPRKDTICRLAHALGCAAKDLVNGGEKGVLPAGLLAVPVYKPPPAKRPPVLVTDGQERLLLAEFRALPQEERLQLVDALCRGTTKRLQWQRLQKERLF